VHKPCIICGTWPEGPLCQFTKDGASFPVARCPDCGLVYSDIVLSPDSVLDDDTPYRYEHYSKNVPSFQQESLRYLNAIHRFKKPGALLDIGCGLGYFMVAAREHGWGVAGIDISPFAVRLAQTEFALENTSVATVDQANFPDEKFDVITLWNCLEHMANPVASLEKAIKWLKPDGLVAVEAPDHDGLIYSVNSVLHRVTDGRLGVSKNLYGSAEGQHVYVFTAESLKRMFARLDFRACYSERTNPPARVLLLHHNLNKGLLKSIVSNTTLYAFYTLAILTRRQHRSLMIFSRG
jgi:SAM-dependent methyltransferase